MVYSMRFKLSLDGADEEAVPKRQSGWGLAWSVRCCHGATYFNLHLLELRLEKVASEFCLSCSGATPLACAWHLSWTLLVSTHDGFGQPEQCLGPAHEKTSKV